MDAMDSFMLDDEVGVSFSLFFFFNIVRVSFCFFLSFFLRFWCGHIFVSCK